MPSDYANDLMARVGLDTTEWKKGITDLNSGIKHIETGFQATAALMDDWSGTSEGLTKRIDSLNDKLALQKKKLDILKTAYEEEVAENGESSKAAEGLAKKMYQVKNEIDRTKASIESYTDKLDNMSIVSDRTVQKLDNLATKTRGLSMVATGALGALGAGLIKAGANADELNTLAKQTGLTTEELQKFKYASDLIDVNLEDMTGALTKMTRNMVSTSSETKAAWETLGVSTIKVNGEAKGITETFYEVLGALSNVRNETERDQLAMQIFGKSANSLAGIVDDGGAALRELGDEAEKLGLIMSQEAVDGANEFNDVIDKLKANVTAEFMKAFSENADDLTEVAQDMAGAIVTVVKTISDLPPGVTKAGVAITTFAAVFSPLVSVGSKTISMMAKLKAAYKSKTTETVKSTAAEAAHSKALDKTASSAAGASKAVKGIGVAAKSATSFLAIVLGSLALINAEVNRTLKEAEEKINNKYKSKKEKSDECFDSVIEKLSKELEETENSCEKSTDRINNYYDNKISRLEEDLEAQKKSIEKEQELLEKAHQKRINQFEKERELKLKVINTTENAKISKIQKEIDELDSLTEAEEKAEKERKKKEKLAELQADIDSAKTYAEKIEAEKQYNEYLDELKQEDVKNAREAQKQKLQNRIETIRQESEKKREQVNNEYNAAVQLENDEYTLAKKGFDNKLKALDTFIEDETEKLEQARKQKLKILKQETEDYLGEIQARIDGEEKKKKDAAKKIENDKQKEKEDLHTFKGFLEAFVSDYNLPENASGTNYWRGGLTRVNEEGGEILNLPRGTQIIPHDVSMEMARAAGRASVTNTTTNNTSNSYNYGAQQQVTVLQVGDRTVAKVITPQVSIGISDTIYRRRRSGGA